MNEESLKQIVRTTLFDLVLGAIKRKLITAAPWLGFAIINPIFNVVIGKLASMFLEEFMLHVSFAYIDADMEKKDEAYQAALTQLKHISSKPRTEQDAHELTLAKNDLRRSLANLIRMRPGSN